MDPPTNTPYSPQHPPAEADVYLQVVMNTVLDGLIIIDDKGTILSFNPSAERIFGYSLDEVVGRNVKMLMPEPYHQGHDGYLHNYLTTGDKKVIGIGREFSGRRKDGTVFPMELGVNEMQVDGPRKFVGTVRDISERKESERLLEVEAARMLAVMNTVLDGLIIIDEKGTVHTFNAASSRIFGYESYEVIGKNVKMLMPEPYHNGHDGYLHNYMTTGEAKVIGIGREVSARRKDGSIFPMELGVNEMIVVGPRMFVGTIRDISERKQAEHEIQQFVEALKRSNQELDDFAYIASHDLKEPIRGLSNNAVFLKEDYEDKIGEDGVKRLGRMTYLCERMERLVNDLLYFSRLGRQELAIQNTDLNAVIREIGLMMENTLHEAGATIVILDTLPTITCDLPRITEVFRNLITNAVKYNKRETKTIEIGCKQIDGECAFFVRDYGIGIDPKFFKDVFRIFKRLNDEDDNVKGTGVGLTFVKKIIERHNGKIWIESEIGAGTTFYFTISDPREA
jgi:PAS domain S-box-containing protein